jgi:uncharacterized delta-60 repeat protein
MLAENSHCHPLAILAGSFLLQFGTLCGSSLAAAADVDLSFDAGFFPGVSVIPVRAVAVQPDGKVIIAGTGIVRLNADGSKDSSFARPIDPNAPVGLIHDIALQSDGKVLVAHDYGLDRLNADGTWDTSFLRTITLDDNLFTERVHAVAVQRNGRILIGGGFTVVNGARRHSIARLGLDGSLDSSFIPETVDGSFSVALRIVLQPDGKILVGGQALTSRNDSVARLNPDGSLDANFFAVRPNEFVSSLALQSDGKVLIGGIFTSINGSFLGYARLHADGSPDNGFEPGMGAEALAVQADGKVLVVGDSLQTGGSIVKGIARLHLDGRLDNTFLPDLNPNRSLSTITLQPDGKMLISGQDVTGNLPPDYNLITRLTSDGRRDGAFVAGKYRGGFANWMMPQADGKVLVGGGFPFIDGTNDAVVASLNADGSLDRILSTNEGLAHAALQPDGKWLANDGSARFNADLSVDGGFQAPVTDFQIYKAVAQPDGRVLIGGNFRTVNGTNGHGIARLNVDGSLDSAFIAEIASAGASIHSILAQADGKILVGGEFSSVDQAVRYGLVRLNADGSLDNTFNHVTATDGLMVDVLDIVPQRDGKLLITGFFFYVHGARRDYIARLNANGGLDSTFDAGSFTGDPEPDLPHVRSAGAITLQSDGKLLVLGSYYLGNDESIQGLFRLNSNGRIDASFDPRLEFPFDVRSVAVQLDGRVLISGGFLAINGVTRPYLARLLGDSNGPMNNPPMVSLSNPPSDSYFVAPANVAITANASDSDGSVARVDFYGGSVLIGSATAEPFEITWNNVPDGAYSISAIATDNDGGTGASALVNINVTAPTPPTAPSGLSATASSSGRIKINWKDNSADEFGFKVERSTKGKPFKQIAVTNQNISTFADKGLAAGQKYTYRVRAYHSSGESAYSSTATARTRKRGIKWF